MRRKKQSKTNNITIAPATPAGSLKEPVKSALDHYLKIQAALADDSTKDVSANAEAISKAVKADQAKTLSSECRCRRGCFGQGQRFA